MFQKKRRNILPFIINLKVILDQQEDNLLPFLEKIRLDAEKKGFNDKVLDQILNDK